MGLFLYVVLPVEKSTCLSAEVSIIPSLLWLLVINLLDQGLHEKSGPS